MSSNLPKEGRESQVTSNYSTERTAHGQDLVEYRSTFREPLRLRFGGADKSTF
jgi:hypothetical protein